MLLLRCLIRSEANGDCIQNDKEDKKSSFDSTLTKAWEEAQENGLFRYVLNIQDTKILDGRYKFLAQCQRRYNVVHAVAPFHSHFDRTLFRN
ncbi:hypothetical protein ANTPLA_LOCUS1856 [Anthophora plagiata]